MPTTEDATDRLRAQDVPDFRIEQQFQADWTGPGIVSGMMGGMQLPPGMKLPF